MSANCDGPRASTFLLVVVYLAFISLGLPDSTLGVAWPKMHESLGVPIGMAGMLMFVVTLLSGISSIASGRLIGRFGTGPVVLVSGLATGTALMVFSQARGLHWLLLAAAPLGFGAGAVDAGLNGFVARHYSGRHMNWLHACWGIGATCGPLIMAYAAVAAMGWRGGYVVIGSIQLALAFIFIFTLRLWNIVPTRAEAEHEPHLLNPPTLGAKSAAARLSGLIFAIYVAAEGTVGLWAGSILVEGRGIGVREAGQCVTAYYGSITLGRILVGFVVDRFGNRILVRAGIALALVGAAAFAFSPSLSGMAIGLVLTGLGFAPVYPGLIHEVPRRFAPEAVQSVIGRQVSGAYIGMATLPPLAGAIAQVSLESITHVVILIVLLLIASVLWLDRLTPLRRHPAADVGTSAVQGTSPP
jgi:MFS family permease